MEKVTLNNVQLDFIAQHDSVLSPYFYGTVACDRLPKKPEKIKPCAYIVNTDPHDKPGKHWLGIWTSGVICEVMDSYALPLDVYQTTQPLQDWLNTNWKHVIFNEQSLQSLYSKSCGDYALMYLKDRAAGRGLYDFLKRFSRHDYVYNDHKVGQMLKTQIIRDLYWKKVCSMNYHQCN